MWERVTAGLLPYDITEVEISKHIVVFDLSTQMGITTKLRVTLPVSR